MKSWDSLVELMDRLRDPGGCPWDREQRPEDLSGYLLEEAHEVADAIATGDPAALKEELGDLVFQVVFLSRIAKERGEFTVDEVLEGIREKMIRRHPHVFGESKAGSSSEVLRQWEDIKRAERGEDPEASALDGVPRGLPAMLRAHRLTTKAARVGFDWSGWEEVLEKVDEELEELRSALSNGSARAGEELGDLLFAIINLTRHLGVDPEHALLQANEKFSRRFRRVEGLLRESGRDAGSAGLDEMEALWRQAKGEEE